MQHQLTFEPQFWEKGTSLCKNEPNDIYQGEIDSDLGHEPGKEEAFG